MTLHDFKLSCPWQLRLGQYFCNTYLSRLKPEDRLHKETSWIYNTEDDNRAEMYIAGLMMDYQWDELPDLEIRI